MRFQLLLSPSVPQGRKKWAHKTRRSLKDCPPTKSFYFIFARWEYPDMQKEIEREYVYHLENKRFVVSEYMVERKANDEPDDRGRTGRRRCQTNNWGQKQATNAFKDFEVIVFLINRNMSHDASIKSKICFNQASMSCKC
jgi:hypothetical protein